MSSGFSALAPLIIKGQMLKVQALVCANPLLARAVAVDENFFDEIPHQVYRGDTALHFAAASFQRDIVNLLIGFGADCRAKNRQGAEPLHYAANANRWRPVQQAETIEALLVGGADCDAVDRSGSAPLHRAVRTRSLPAVKTLLGGGADPNLPNRSGSAPLHLAVQTTGRSGSGSAHVREQQMGFIKLLLERGANPMNVDGRGKTALDSARGERLRAFLGQA